MRLRRRHMHDFENIAVEKGDGIGWIFLNRPDAFNALNLPMAKELYEAGHEMGTDSEVRVVVVSGRGKAFFAGGDVKDMRASIGSEKFLRDLAFYLHGFVSDIARMPKPVIAAVNGTAAGAGFSLAMACDLTLAAEGARFIMAYTGIGLVPDGGSTYFLPRLVGYKRAVELALLNRPLTAREAMELGLVNVVLPEEGFLERVGQSASDLAKGPSRAFGDCKRLLRLGMMESLETQMEHERRMIMTHSLDPEFAEGVSAFAEKRRPRFP